MISPHLQGVRPASAFAWYAFGRAISIQLSAGTEGIAVGLAAGDHGLKSFTRIAES
jgi:hypothetical protein